MRDGNLPYAILGLIACRVDGAHGYQLKRELEAFCDDARSINYAAVYRLLQMLEQDGDLEGSAEVQTGRPNRRTYRLTERGMQTVEQWLVQPTDEDPFPLRDELALKLLFLDVLGASRVATLLESERSARLARLRRVARRQAILRRGGLDLTVAELLSDVAESRVRAELQWLGRVEQTILGNGNSVG